MGGPRWVSQWATLAASHIRTDPEGSGGESHILVTEDRGIKFRFTESQKRIPLIFIKLISAFCSCFSM